MEGLKNYDDFLDKKRQLGTFNGFNPINIPDFLYDFQKSLLDWSLRKGKGAIFADCGLGKTPIQLAWAESIVEKTNKRVIIATPLAVSYQTIKEGRKFGIECIRSDDGQPKGKITVTNYERLHLFNSEDFIGMVADESSILKNFEGTRKKLITDFMRKRPYRLLCTATAAPNDYIELGTSSEAIGELGYMDMLNRFFKNDNNTSAINRFRGEVMKWRFKKHAQVPFWRWVASWARALRKPSDLGFDDQKFILPPLIENQILIDNTKPLLGELLVRPAIGLHEQRDELRLTIKERCEKVAEIVGGKDISVVWCSLNAEGDLLEKIIPNAVQVSGKDSDTRKEEKLMEFSEGKIKVLITKSKIAGFGLNWQHCNHVTFFPSHSFEQYYQSVRRCWRFGQTRPVTVDIITTGGSMSVLENLQRKAKAADDMFAELIKFMNNSIKIDQQEYKVKMEAPKWL